MQMLSIQPLTACCHVDFNVTSLAVTRVWKKKGRLIVEVERNPELYDPQSCHYIAIRRQAIAHSFEYPYRSKTSSVQSAPLSVNYQRM